jgi:hypothetical protein
MPLLKALHDEIVRNVKELEQARRWKWLAPAPEPTTEGSTMPIPANPVRFLRGLGTIPPMTIVFPLLVALAGLIVYCVCTNAKFSELGRITFFCGLLAFLMKR